MPPEDLSDFRTFILNSSDKIDPQEIHSISAGFEKEPILISLIIALGGPVIVKELVSLTKEWISLRHHEKMMKMKIEAKFTNGDSKEISITELEDDSI
jgi:hypothetical protein